jgi:hypothetical protein
MCRVPRLLLTFGSAGQQDVPGAQPALGEAKQQPARADLSMSSGCAPIASTESG